MTPRERLVFELSLLAATVWSVAFLVARDLRNLAVRLVVYPGAIVSGYRKTRRVLLDRRAAVDDSCVVQGIELDWAREQLRRAREEGRLN